LQKGKDISETDIIKGCIKGKIKYQEMLYRKYYAYGMSITLRYTKNREDALEVLNDGFLKVFDNIKHFDRNKIFKTWFRQILINTALDLFRKNKRMILTENIDKLEYEYFEEKNIDKLEAEDLLNILKLIPEHYSVIFNLYEIEGYKHNEIAEMLNIPESTSRANLSRAKKLLRQIFKKQHKKTYAERI